MCRGSKLQAYLRCLLQVASIVFRCRARTHSSIAYQGVVLYGELHPGENILIHAAATGVGIAAIQMAHVIGACVRSRLYQYLIETSIIERT